jgi:hypothetical protein
MKVGQRKISLPKGELDKAKIQAERDGFGSNVTGWVRWLIRKNCTVIPSESVNSTA